MIVKYVQPYMSGIQPHDFTRHGIGFILRGRKYIYNGDTRQEITRGDIFYIGPGHHYMEDIPEEGKPFEQIMFYYSPEAMSRILTHLSLDYGLVVVNDHTCLNCHERNYVVYPAWNMAKSFFTTINQYLREGLFTSNKTAENLKMAELIYLFINQKDCCIKTKILGNIDSNKDQFEQLIHKNIFNDVSIEVLAQQCNRSLTSFKKEFKKIFFEPPHKWFIRQRLMYARLQLISTSKSISEIGNQCSFPNTSHFIKLFKKEYGMTPSAYRQKHWGSNDQRIKDYEKTTMNVR